MPARKQVEKDKPAPAPAPKKEQWRCISDFNGWLDGRQLTFIKGSTYDGPDVEYAAALQPSWFEKE